MYNKKKKRSNICTKNESSIIVTKRKERFNIYECIFCLSNENYVLCYKFSF